MNLFGARQKQLLSFLTANAERETLDYVLQGMKEVLGDEMPEEDAVRAYLQDPDEPISLSTEQQIVALDKLLECAEVNLRPDPLPAAKGCRGGQFRGGVPASGAS